MILNQRQCPEPHSAITAGSIDDDEVRACSRQELLKSILRQIVAFRSQTFDHLRFQRGVQNSHIGVKTKSDKLLTGFLDLPYILFD